MRLIGLLCIGAPLAAALWPIPTKYTSGTDVLWIDGNVKVDYENPDTGRTYKTIFDQSFVPWRFHPRFTSFEPSTDNKNFISSIVLKQNSADVVGFEKPNDTTVDESYQLSVATSGEVKITANSSVGLVYGLTTFTQLFFKHTAGGSYTNLAPVEIQDAPKFAHRGINMDVARSYFPVSDIKRVLDAMAQTKLNRFHLHVTDAQSWPLEIPALPELSGKGAYYTGLVYTPEDLKDIQEYARSLAIEPYLEIDMPGHTSSIWFSNPDLVAAFNTQPNWNTYCAEPPCGTLKLNSSAVDDFLEKLFDDLLPRVTEYSTYYHTGGDEVNKQAYLLDDTVKSNDSAVLQPLMQKFIDRNHDQVRKYGLTPVVWEEMLLEWNLTLGKDVLVQTWQSDAAVAQTTEKGYKALAGNYNYWYLDCGLGQWLDFRPESAANYYPFADYCSPRKNWKLIYSYDPLSGVPADQQHLVVGGECHMWTEQTDSATIDRQLWPRAAAAAEVLWSGAKDEQGQNRSQILASPRLVDFRERLIARGVQAELPHMAFCTQNGTQTLSLRWSRCSTLPAVNNQRVVGSCRPRPICHKMLESLGQDVSVFNIGVFLGASYLIYALVARLNDSRRIRALGGPAPAIRSWVPWGLDLVYTTLKAVWNNQAYEMWHNIFYTYGNPTNPYTVEFRLGGMRMIFTADPENIKAILAAQFQDYGKGERFNREWHDFLGDSIFTTDGDEWYQGRQMLRPLFLKDRISDLEVHEKHVQILLEHLGGDGQTVDIMDLLFRFTLDCATEFLFGRSVDSQENPSVEFADAFAKVQHTQSVMAKIGPVNRFYPRGEFRRNIKKMEEFVQPFLEQVLSLSPEELEKRTKNEEGFTFLHALAGYTRDARVLRDQLTALLLAGRDTTACTLSWLFYELSIHPTVVQKLRREILDVVGPHSKPTYEHLKSMKYLQNTLNETMRLYPAVPFNVRTALKDTTLPHGGGPDGNSPVGVLKGTPIGYTTLMMQHSPDIYPPISSGFPPIHTFAPERWESWVPRPWTFIPFNGGPRICLGQQFARTEMAYTVVRLLQRFEKIECRGDGHPGVKMDILMQPARENYVAFWAAKV
ncbi:putative cytochrome 52A4 [Phyllosticta citriasiana]|uniref:putative cytochrome 52A4 n=1 Tax=Phyllosticta citriasiana TaxID=595635 RepID=UPI0030FD7CFF